MKQYKKEPIIPPFSYVSRSHIGKGAIPDFIFGEFKNVIAEYQLINTDISDDKTE